MLKFEERSVEMSATFVPASVSLVNLPKLEIKSFDLCPASWIQFWAQFQVIDEDGRLSEETKFQYLIQSIQPGSKAARLLGSFPPSKENYPKALSAVKT